MKQMPSEESGESEESDESDANSARDAQAEWESVNSAKALWTRSRSDVEADEYKEFYKHVSHDFDDPLVWSHNRVEGKLEYTSLLFIPQRAPFDVWNREAPRGFLSDRGSTTGNQDSSHELEPSVTRRQKEEENFGSMVRENSFHCG